MVRRKVLPKDMARARYSKEFIKHILECAYSDFNTRSLGLILHVCYHTAQPTTSLLKLTWKDLDLTKGTLTVKGKELPLGEGLTRTLTRQKKDFDFQPFIFPKYTPTRWMEYSKSSFTRRVALFKKQHSLKFSEVTLIHTAIYEMIEDGVQLHDIMALTGLSYMTLLRFFKADSEGAIERALGKRTDYDLS